MRKQLLIKYIKGEATRQEELRVAEWARKSPDNKKYLTSLNNLWLASILSSNESIAKQAIEEGSTTGSSMTGSNSTNASTTGSNSTNASATNAELATHKQLAALRRKSALRSKFSYAAVALLVISLAVNLFMYYRSSRTPQQQRVVLAELAQDQKVSVYTNNGVKGNIVLPDGSVVWLNSASRLTYPMQFEGDTREVQLIGEAYFEVVKDSLHPMIVSTGKNFYVEVLGTKFNLKAYADDQVSQATLYSGEIKVHTANKVTNESKELLLKPMETILIGDRNLATIVSDIEEKEKTNAEWKDGILTFKNTPLKEVIKSVERWHGTQFTIKDSSILNYRITASFNSESAVQIMDMIRYISPVDYKANGNQITLSRR